MGVARAGVGVVSVSRGARGRLSVVSLAIAMDLSQSYVCAAVRSGQHLGAVFKDAARHLRPSRAASQPLPLN